MNIKKTQEKFNLILKKFKESYPLDNSNLIIKIDEYADGGKINSNIIKYKKQITKEGNEVLGYIWRVCKLNEKLYHCIIFSTSNPNDNHNEYLETIYNASFDFELNKRNRKFGKSRKLIKPKKEVSVFESKEISFRKKTGKDFSTVYVKYYPKLKYFVNKICNDTQLAEDISTESFFVALDKIDKYDTKYQFSTWLFTIAKNMALQDKKTRSNKISSIDIVYGDGDISLKDFLADTNVNVLNIQSPEYNEEHLDALDKKALIMKNQIDILKEPYKTVITMREIERKSYQDIADILGRNLNTIKSQIKNGRKLLIDRTENDFKSIDKILLQ